MTVVAVGVDASGVAQSLLTPPDVHRFKGTRSPWPNLDEILAPMQSSALMAAHN
jgi:hypothetical protein